MNWSRKKTDKLEVRLPTEAKQAFLARCRSEGRSASEVVRSLIETYLARPLNPKEPPLAVRLTFAYAGIAAVAVAAAVTLSPRSTQAEPDVASVFRSLDRDGNGRLTLAEFDNTSGRPPAAPKPNETSGGVSAAFSDTDTNGDNLISLAEFEAVIRAAMVKRFLALDANSDGKLTIAELRRPGAPLGEPKSGMAITGPAEGFFAKFDADEDGAITEAEFSLLPGAGPSKPARGAPAPARDR